MHIAIITGASSGLGLALAEALARRGRNLILVARQRETLEPVAIELTQRFGVEVLFRACDLSQPLRLSGFVLELEEGERGLVDVGTAFVCAVGDREDLAHVGRDLLFAGY